jgi:NAD(P)-dependent dehydrogenase (short-subunit alcohol dehydrogenase family)
VRIEGANVLITGANRGLGKALMQAALDGGAGKVYAAARDPRSVTHADKRITVVKLDVTQQRLIDAAAEACRDVDIVMNNAAFLANMPAVGAADIESGRLEMETNYWGVLRMMRAFAPRLSARGGGALVNILSVGALAGVPPCGSYSASKAAAWSLTQSARTELAAQGTKVFAVFPGPIATEMAPPGQEEGRHPPAQIARAIFAAIVADELMIFPDPVSAVVAENYARSPWSLESVFAGTRN